MSDPILDRLTRLCQAVIEEQFKVVLAVDSKGQEFYAVTTPEGELLCTLPEPGVFSHNTTEGRNQLQ